MACGEFDVEPGYECVDEILRLSHFEHKGGLKGKISRSNGIKIDGENSRGIGYASLDFHGVDKRLG